MTTERGFEILDFRARPNTKEFMAIYEQPDSRDPWAKFRSVRPSTTDLTGYLDQLKSEGIDHTVFTGRQGVLAGANAIPNDFVLEAGASSERVTPFVGIGVEDTASALKEIDRCLAAGAKGFAFDPPTPMGYASDAESWDGPMMRPVLERIAELGLPAVFTMGPVVGKHGDPEPVDRVAAALPDLTIVCSHGVWPRTAELIALAFRRPNVFLETSIYLTYPGTSDLIAQAANSLLADQLLYASAFPFMPLNSYRAVEALDVSDETKQKILAGNARRLLG